jgi:hypothetical protein
MKDVLQENYTQFLYTKKLACVVITFGEAVEVTVHINKITKITLRDAVHTFYQDITYFENVTRFNDTRVNL